MSLDYYNPREKHWVSPRLVLVYYDRLIKKYGSNVIDKDRKFRKAKEAKVAAVNLLGMQKQDPKNYLMQVPKKINESPDIVTMNLREYPDKPVQMEIQDIEIIEYTPSEKRELSDFLIEEKLSPKISKKAYDKHTVILCHIQKGGRFSSYNIHNRLNDLKPEPHVLLLGKVSSNVYETTQVWPVLGSIKYDIIEEVRKYPRPDAKLIGLGSGKKIINTDSGKPLPTLEEVFEIRL